MRHPVGRWWKRFAIITLNESIETILGQTWQKYSIIRRIRNKDPLAVTGHWTFTTSSQDFRPSSQILPTVECNTYVCDLNCRLTINGKRKHPYNADPLALLSLDGFGILWIWAVIKSAVAESQRNKVNSPGQRWEAMTLNGKTTLRSIMDDDFVGRNALGNDKRKEVKESMDGQEVVDIWPTTWFDWSHKRWQFSVPGRKSTRRLNRLDKGTSMFKDRLCFGYFN